MKKQLKLQTALVPVPAVIVTCSNQKGEENAIAIAWTGVVNSSPPMLYVSVRENRHSHQMILETKEFVINIPDGNTAKALDYTGITSGRDVDKFSEMNLTKLEAATVKAPLIEECPVNIECKVKHILNLGSHDMFIAEVVGVHADEAILSENGSIDMDKFNAVVYATGKYLGIGEIFGTRGFSKK